MWRDDPVLGCDRPHATRKADARVTPDRLVVLFISDREYAVGAAGDHQDGEKTLVLPAGTVTFVEEGQYDRNTSCTGSWSSRRGSTTSSRTP